MRFWVVCLFVVLLPWRLWAADAMALQALHGAPAPAQQMPCHGAAHAVSHDTLTAEGALHSSALAHAGSHSAEKSEMHSASTPADTNDHSPHGMCLLCDVCHNALGLSPTGPSAHAQALHHPPTALTERVASAARQPGFKPPIA